MTYCNSGWAVAAGLCAAALAALAGAVDYASIREGHPALGAATRHMLLMLTAVTPYLASLLVRGGPAPPAGRSLVAVLALEFAGVVLLSVGGWYGGHLVFHHGIGVDEQGEKGSP